MKRMFPSEVGWPPSWFQADPIHWLRWACVMLLLARAWQYFFWVTPWHLWSAPLAWGGGALLVAGAMAAVIPGRPGRWRGPVLASCGTMLLAQMLLQVATQGFRLPDLMEHTLGWASPWLLLLAASGHQAWPLLARIAVALTFTGHGLFALGWPWPLPPHFGYMTTRITGLTPEGAQWLLRLAGSLDLLVSVGIFMPRLAKPALVYAIIWGGLTALARPTAYVLWPSFWPDLHRWGMEMAWRLPHALVPLAILRLYLSAPNHVKAEESAPDGGG